MRDISLSLALLVAFILGFIQPYIGLLSWSWLTVCNPHQEVFSFALERPFNSIVALQTMSMSLVKGLYRKLPNNSTPPIMLIFSLWFSLTTYFAYDRPWAFKYWNLDIKIFMFMFVYMSIGRTRIRIQAMMWVFAISLGYWGVKGGIFTVATGGSAKVFGPPNSQIEDNNQLAVALILITPIFFYLMSTTPNKLLKSIMGGSVAFMVIAVLGTYSRGGLISLLTMLGQFWWTSKAKAMNLAIGIPLVAGALAMMPQTFWDRMNTIKDAKEGKDESFQGRVHAWQVAYRYATDHFPLGAGFACPQLDGVFAMYCPGCGTHAAHSIYFMVLGEHGWPGLVMYLFMLAGGVWHTFWIEKQIKTWVGWKWAYELSRMCRVALLSFYVGGAALSLSYYDVYLALIATTSMLRQMVVDEMARRKKEETERLKKQKQAERLAAMRAARAAAAATAAAVPS